MTLSTLRPTQIRLTEPSDPRHYVADAEHQLMADPARRRPVRFRSDGVQLAGHLYGPPRAGEGHRTPAIVMCGRSSSVKEQTLPHYAQLFADGG
jgi:uncharacterized protein